MEDQQTEKFGTAPIYDVAIVGAGIAGLVSAVVLGQQGFSVLLLDAMADDASIETTNIHERGALEDYSPRVSAITPANAQYLDSLDIWSSLPTATCLDYQKMSVWEQLGGGKIQFDALDYQREALGYIVENKAIENAAGKQVLELDNVAWIRSAQVNACTYDIHSELACLETLDSSFRARLVIAADGANSGIRRFMGFQTLEWDYEQHAIVCTVQCEHSHQRTAFQRFSERGPVAMLPLADSVASDSERKGRFCSLVWSVDNEFLDDIIGLDEPDFCMALENELEGQLGHIQAVSRRHAFPLRQRQAKQYVKHNAVLVADAAHTIHPLAGQGLNLGLSDVKTLGDLLANCKDSAAPLNHPVILRRYQRQRQLDNMTMAAAMEAFKRLFGSRDPVVRLMRNTGVNWVDRHTLIKRRIAHQAMGLI